MRMPLAWALGGERPATLQPARAACSECYDASAGPYTHAEESRCDTHPRVLVLSTHRQGRLAAVAQERGHRKLHWQAFEVAEPWRTMALVILAL